MNLSSYGWIIALGTSAGVFWAQIKEIFSRLTSTVFIQVELDYNLSELFMDYAWTHLKRISLGSRRYDGQDVFIRPKNQWGFVTFEMCGKNITFLNRFFPIFLSKDDDAKGPPRIHLSYLRGTFDIESILIKISENKKEVEIGEKRYRVQKLFGTRKNNKNYEGRSLSEGQPSALEMKINDKGRRYLKWNKNEIGAPTDSHPFSALAYSEGIETLHSELRRWRDSKGWYKSRGLDWRFGVLLEGLPGTGKTSFIRAIGQEFDYPVFQFDLVSMTNEDLSSTWKAIISQSPCIIVLEDFDRVTFSGELTLDTLLNCISGIEPADGCLLFITANDASQLDSALLRPGRLDRRVTFTKLENTHRIKIAGRILSDYPELVEEVALSGEGETGAQFTQRCSSLALERYWKK